MFENAYSVDLFSLWTKNPWTFFPPVADFSVAVFFRGPSYRIDRRETSTVVGETSRWRNVQGRYIQGAKRPVTEQFTQAAHLRPDANPLFSIMTGKSTVSELVCQQLVLSPS